MSEKGTFSSEPLNFSIIFLYHQSKKKKKYTFLFYFLEQ